MRKTGVDVVGDMPWGTHFCLFYEPTADLLETSVSYCKAGLEGQECCLWVIAEPLAVEEATRALKLELVGTDSVHRSTLPAIGISRQRLRAAPLRRSYALCLSFPK